MTTKRRFCVSAVGLLATAVAGCGSTTPTGDTTTESPTATRTESASTDSPTATETPSMSTIDAEVESDQGECTESQTPSATISETDDGVAVSGRIVAPTPCHLARVTEQSVEDRTVRFRIDVRENPEVASCVQCIAEVPFELTATLDGIESVVVAIEGNEPETFRQDLS
jgi:hypothetical protein